MFDDDNVNDEYQDDVEHGVDNEVIDDEQDVDDTDEQDSQDDEADSQDDDVLEFSFDEDDDDESDPFKGQEAPDWVKDTRKKYREAERENRRLKKQLEQQTGQHEQQALREKPTLDAHDYEDDAYQADLEQWFVEKQQHDAKVQAEQQKYQQYDERYVNDVNAMKAKAPDYDEIEQSIVDTLPTSKQAMLKMLVDNPAKMVYALGKSPIKLQALSELDDIQFAKQIVLMEQSMSTVKRNPNKPKPKSHSLEGSAGGGDTKLAKLEADAERTGDRSKVVAYKQTLRKK